MMVMTHAARDVLSRSVGENASPKPWLSVGASVRSVWPDFRCMFSVRNWRDDSSMDANELSQWTRSYAAYLEEVVVNLDKIPRLDRLAAGSNAAEATEMRTCTEAELMEKLPRIQNAMRRLLDCEAVNSNLTTNDAVIAGVSLLLKDSFKLYRLVNDGIIRLIDVFFNMRKLNALKALGVTAEADDAAPKLPKRNLKAALQRASAKASLATSLSRTVATDLYGDAAGPLRAARGDERRAPRRARVAVDRRARPDQQPRHLGVPVLARRVQRRRAAAGGGHVGAEADEQPSDVGVALEAGDEEGREAAAVGGVHARARRHEQLADAHVPLLARQAQPLQRLSDGRVRAFP